MTILNKRLCGAVLTAALVSNVQADTISELSISSDIFGVVGYIESDHDSSYIEYGAIYQQYINEVIHFDFNLAYVDSRDFKNDGKRIEILVGYNIAPHIDIFTGFRYQHQEQNNHLRRAILGASYDFGNGLKLIAKAHHNNYAEGNQSSDQIISPFIWEDDPEDIPVIIPTFGGVKYMEYEVQLNFPTILNTINTFVRIGDSETFTTMGYSLGRDQYVTLGFNVNI